jgi:hypothetical protein
LTAQAFLKGDADAMAIHAAVRAALEKSGAVTERITKSQIGFYRRHPVAALWVPGRYLSGDRPPLVLTVFLPQRDPWTGWKSVVEPAPGRFTHHVELRSADLPPPLTKALAAAWSAAG